MSLSVATTGVCAGHACDGCRTCTRGCCCRRDNPNYQLPKEGEWDGTIYGQLGTIQTNGDKVECHACGGWFSSVALHAIKIHRLYAFEYKAIFGLKRTATLDSPASSARRTARTAAMVASGRIPTFSGHPEWRATPEQLSGYNKGKKRRTQTLNTLQEPNYRETLNQKISDATRQIHTITCNVCGTVVKRNAANRKSKACSKECGRKSIAIATTKRHADARLAKRQHG